VARTLLGDAGFDLAHAQAWTSDGWGTRMAWFRPALDGLPVFWWETTVTVNADRTVERANGWLATPAAEGDYPLLTPQQAIDRGSSGPRPLPAIQCDALTPECTGEAPEREVTAVRLGLVMLPSYESDGDFYLAPAWLLTVKDSPQEEPLLALPDEYLETPPTPSEEPKPVPVESGGAVDGSTGTAPNGGTVEEKPDAPPPTR
jgi:hypothetical protein